jgi:hypothetical protein
MPASLPLPPNGFIATNGITLQEEPALAGTVIVDDLIPFSYGGKLPGGGTYVNSGKVQARIVKRASGTLDFYWRVFSDGTSAVPLQAIEMLAFGTPADIFKFNYRIDGLGDVPTVQAARDPEVLYGIGFKGPLQPGQTSKFFFAETNAVSYSKNNPLTISDGHATSGNIMVYTP